MCAKNQTSRAETPCSQSEVSKLTLLDASDASIAEQLLVCWRCQASDQLVTAIRDKIRKQHVESQNLLERDFIYQSVRI